MKYSLVGKISTLLFILLSIAMTIPTNATPLNEILIDHDSKNHLIKKRNTMKFATSIKQENEFVHHDIRTEKRDANTNDIHCNTKNTKMTKIPKTDHKYLRKGTRRSIFNGLLSRYVDSIHLRSRKIINSTYNIIDDSSTLYGN